MVDGTLPLRKPGSRASFWTRLKAFSHASWTTSGPSSTCRRRLHAPISSTATFIQAPELKGWCERGGPTPHGYAPLDLKPSASASSATLAMSGSEYHKGHGG